jgi:uncharacterized protein (DUF2141 family)
MFRSLSLVSVFFSMSLAVATTAHAADLTVTVKDVNDHKGNILIAVYDQSNFGKPELAKIRQRAKASNGSVKFVFHNLPAGTYAVSAFHDENGNNKLDRNSLGVPSEGYGFSNDAQGTAGPPTFSQAEFTTDGKTDKSIDFSLNY